MTHTAQEFTAKYGWQEQAILPQDGDTRTYTRVIKNGKSALVMDIPRNEHAMLEYMRIGKYLSENGIRVPEVYEAEPHNGFALIEDFGSVHMRHALEKNTYSADHLYGQAFEILDQIKSFKTIPPLCAYESHAVHHGRRRVMEWYFPASINKKLETKYLDEYLAIWDHIEKCLPAYKRGVVHGDFHVDNLMVLEDGSLGVIDFQDAMYGSPLYDLGNLLEDMRANVPQEIQQKAIARLSEEERAWMRILTTQFHMRLLGQCLLWDIRANKPQYLKFLPRLETYVRTALQNDPLLKPLKEFFDYLRLDFTLSQDLNTSKAQKVIDPEAF